MHSAPDPPARTDGGCPIRVRLAHRSLAAPQSRFAALRALLRPLAPRHPPYTLLRLAYLHPDIPASNAFLNSRYDPRSRTNTTLSLASAKSKYITICDCQSAIVSSH